MPPRGSNAVAKRVLPFTWWKNGKNRGAAQGEGGEKGVGGVDGKEKEEKIS